jgi:hypothetical protein
MSSAANPMYGVVSIDGKQYLERWQVMPFELSVTVGLSSTGPIKVPLPGVYDFRLKGLTRAVLAAGALVSRPFRCRIGNTDGAIWYSQGGLGGATDKVLDSNMFGNGQFPYPIIPALYYGKNASIMLDIDDLSNSVPYTIVFAFHGAYLIPV